MRNRYWSITGLSKRTLRSMGCIVNIVDKRNLCKSCYQRIKVLSRNKCLWRRAMRSVGTVQGIHMRTSFAVNPGNCLSFISLQMPFIKMVRQNFLGRGHTCPSFVVCPCTWDKQYDNINYGKNERGTHILKYGRTYVRSLICNIRACNLRSKFEQNRPRRLAL